MQKKKKKKIRILFWFDTNHLLHSLNSKIGLLFSLTVYFRDQSTPYNEFFYKFKIQTFSTDPFTQSSRLNPPNLFHKKRLKPTNPFTQGSRSNPLIIFIKKTNDWNQWNLLDQAQGQTQGSLFHRYRLNPIWVLIKAHNQKPNGYSDIQFNNKIY